MEDTCNPLAKTTIQDYRIYHIIIPIVALIIVLETIFIFMSIPSDRMGWGPFDPKTYVAKTI
jgi:hypothetical protein